jgi:drug/metabolite transporter (DMT)-like permease|uniref:DMT family transporter n=1 Tax=Cephaloticoccus sp. TaxID=1985742 RepID=UPI00404AB02D
MTQSTPAKASPHHARGIILMVLSTVGFTANILLIRAFATLEGTNMWFLVCMRFLTGLFLISTIYHREFQPRNLLLNPRLIARGVIGGIGTAGYYITIAHLGAGRATFIGNTYVIWGGLLAVWVLSERFTLRLAVGCVSTLSGIALLTNVIGTAMHPGIYDVLALVTAFASATVIVLIRQLHAKEHTSTIFAAQCVYGLLICSIPAWHLTDTLPTGSWWIILGASVSAAVGQLCMTRAFRDLTVGEGSLLQMLVPLGVAIGGVLLFSEHYTATELIGAVLILGGSVLPSLRR